MGIPPRHGLENCPSETHKAPRSATFLGHRLSTTGYMELARVVRMSDSNSVVLRISSFGFRALLIERLLRTISLEYNLCGIV
jgi:hypothetical protein